MDEQTIMINTIQYDQQIFAAINDTDVMYTWGGADDDVTAAGVQFAAESLSDSLSTSIAANNESDKTSSQNFTVQGQQSTTDRSSTFKLSGTEYAYVQVSGLTKSDFTITTFGNKEQFNACTESTLVDAEKSSLNLAEYYLYTNVCWAATASNMFVSAGWAKGIFDTEDKALRYIIDNFTKPDRYRRKTKIYPSVTVGCTQYAVEWLLEGYNSFWERAVARHNAIGQNFSQPIDKTFSGLYRNVTSKAVEDKYLQQFSISISKGSIKNYTQYAGKGGYEKCAESENFSYSMVSNAFNALKDGYSIGVSIGSFTGHLWEREGGHAITAYGFTYDASKQGTPEYFTGIIVADSDDDWLNGSELWEYPPEDAPNRIKVIPMEYNSQDGVYVLGGGYANWILQGVQYLQKKPDNVTYSVSPAVRCSTKAEWNSSYSIASSESAALGGQTELLSADDDVYVAINLTNKGLGNSESITVKVVIDQDESKAKTFTFSEVLEYDESSSDIVFNLGSLSHGTHNVGLTISDGSVSSKITISDLYVSYVYDSEPQIIVQAGEVSTGVELVDEEVMAVFGTAQNTIVGAGCDQIIKADGRADGTKIMADGLLSVEAGGSAANTEIFEEGFLVANGKADGTTVHAKGSFFAERNSNVVNTRIEAGGVMDIDFRGHAESTEVYGTLTVTNGEADKTTVYADGFLLIHETGKATGTVVQDNGDEYVENGGYAENNTLTGKECLQDVRNDGSRAVDNILDAATQTVSDYGVVMNSEFRNGAVQKLYEGACSYTAELSGGACQYIFCNATAYDTTVNADCTSFVFDGGFAFKTVVKANGCIVVGDPDGTRGAGAVEALTVEYNGTLRLEDGATLFGNTTVAGNLLISGTVFGETESIQDVTPCLTFDFSSRTTSDDYLVSNVSLLNDLVFDIVINEDTANGIYKLSADGASDFTDSIEVYGTDEVFYGELSLTQQIVMNGHLVSLQTNANGASLDIVVETSPYQDLEILETSLSTVDHTCSWGHVAKAESYIVQFSKDNFQTSVSIETTEESIALNNLPFDLQWRVRAAGSSVWTEGTPVSASKTEEANLVRADKNWNFDLLFAVDSGKWGSDYFARHVGCCDEWSGTKERVALSGKNVIADVFEGSSDANVLVLTDDACGDAMFVDDIYSAFPGTRRARIVKIQEIHAGAGDDIVDMTSQRFEYKGYGLVIRGGEGNDTIWANNGDNMLFGDAGDDRLVGASGNDVLAGGIGNDSMHGGGGNDVFCFCNDWGHDTVEQLSDGTVTLWFVDGDQSHWNADTLTYSDGVNSVKVTGITAENVTLKFGDDGSAQFDTLSDSGAFQEFSSEKIFEEEGKDVLASSL